MQTGCGHKIPQVILGREHARMLCQAPPQLWLDPAPVTSQDADLATDDLAVAAEVVVR